MKGGQWRESLTDKETNVWIKGKSLNFTERNSCTHTGALHQKLLHKKAFRQRSFYTQKLLHTDAFTQRSLYTRTRLHTEAFTQKLLHRAAFTRRSLHTAGDREVHTHTELFTQRSLLHRAAFTRRNFYTEELLHRKTFTHRAFSAQGKLSRKVLDIFRQLHLTAKKPLHRRAFAHRRWYAKKLFRIETFIQRTLYGSFIMSHVSWSFMICHPDIFVFMLFWSTPSCSSFGQHRRLVFILHGVLSVHASSSLPFAAKQTAHDVSIKILRRFRAEHGRPHHRISF